MRRNKGTLRLCAECGRKMIVGLFSSRKTECTKCRKLTALIVGRAACARGYLRRSGRQFCGPRDIEYLFRLAAVVPAKATGHSE